MCTFSLLGTQISGKLLAPTSDQVSSKWLTMLLYKSCTTEMKEVLMLEYGNLDVCFCGGVTFAWIVRNKLFGLNQNTTAASVNFLKLFWNKGVHRYQGRNVALAWKKLLAVRSCLAESKGLLQEMPVDLLTGLTLCLVFQFKTLCHRPWPYGRKHSLLKPQFAKLPIADVRFNLKSKPNLRILRDSISK
jgi:hypothetical protein